MIFMLTLCWRLSLVPFIVVPVILVCSKIFGVYYDYLSEKTQEAVAHSNDVAEEVGLPKFAQRHFRCFQPCEQSGRSRARTSKGIGSTSNSPALWMLRAKKRNLSLSKLYMIIDLPTWGTCGSRR